MTSGVRCSLKNEYKVIHVSPVIKVEKGGSVGEAAAKHLEELINKMADDE